MVATQKQILLLGANGKVGRLLAHMWALNPPQQMTFQFQSRGIHHRSDWTSFKAGDDPAIFGKIDGVLALWRPMATSLDLENTEVRLAQEAIKIATICGADRVLFASSVAVYGRGQGFVETDPPAPTNGYGLAKLAMERAVAQSSFPTCVLRIGSVLGADSLGIAKSKGPVTLDRFDDGHGPWRSYITPTILAQVIVRLFQTDIDALPPILNVGAHLAVSMDQILTAMDHPFSWKVASNENDQFATMNTSQMHQRLGLKRPRKIVDDITKDWKHH